MYDEFHDIIDIQSNELIFSQNGDYYEKFEKTFLSLVGNDRFNVWILLQESFIF